MATQTPPTTQECADLLARVYASLLCWAPTRDTARADALDARNVLHSLVGVHGVAPRCNELYESPVDAGEAVALVCDTLADREGVGYRRALIVAACALLRRAIRDHRAQFSDRSVSYADVSAHDAQTVRAARGA